MTRYAPVAQLDRAQASDAWCRRFKSCSVRQKIERAHFVPFLFFRPPSPIQNLAILRRKAQIGYGLRRISKTISSTARASIGSKSCSVRQKQADCPKGAVCLFFVHFDRFEPHARKSVTFAPGKETVCTTFSANIGSESCSYPIQNLAILRRKAPIGYGLRRTPNRFPRLLAQAQVQNPVRHPPVTLHLTRPYQYDIIYNIPKLTFQRYV